METAGRVGKAVGAGAITCMTIEEHPAKPVFMQLCTRVSASGHFIIFQQSLNQTDSDDASGYKQEMGTSNVSYVKGKPLDGEHKQVS